jgi:hypothetical protein
MDKESNVDLEGHLCLEVFEDSLPCCTTTGIRAPSIVVVGGSRSWSTPSAGRLGRLSDGSRLSTPANRRLGQTRLSNGSGRSCTPSRGLCLRRTMSRWAFETLRSGTPSRWLSCWRTLRSLSWLLAPVATSVGGCRLDRSRLNWCSRLLTPSRSSRSLLSRSSRSHTPTITIVHLSRSSWRTPSTAITALSRSLAILTLTLTIVRVSLELELLNVTGAFGSETLGNVLLKEVGNDLMSLKKSLD